MESPQAPLSSSRDFTPNIMADFSTLLPRMLEIACLYLGSETGCFE
jgi:hypothetical protein